MSCVFGSYVVFYLTADLLINRHETVAKELLFSLKVGVGVVKFLREIDKLPARLMNEHRLSERLNRIENKHPGVCGWFLLDIIIMPLPSQVILHSDN
jgi:hypothetical protein